MKKIMHQYPKECGAIGTEILSKEEAIRRHREIHPELCNEPDDLILQDFMVIHWAWEVDCEDSPSF